MKSILVAVLLLVFTLTVPPTALSGPFDGLSNFQKILPNQQRNAPQNQRQAPQGQRDSGQRDGGAKIHSYTQMTYDKWLQNMETDRAIADSSKPLDEKLKELEGGKRWFDSNRQELKKHPSFEQGMEQIRALNIKLAVLKTQKAVSFAETGLKEKNPNMFNPSSGTYQQLKEADKLLEECKQDKGVEDPGCSGLAKTIDDARASVEQIKLQHNRASAEAFRLPPEKYTGKDKAKLKQIVLEKWKELYPNDKVLGVRFHKDVWERKKESNYNNGTWYHYDNSVLVTYVVIKTSAELATVYPAYLNKNNQTGAITVGAETKGNDYSHAEMLMKNVSF